MGASCFTERDEPVAGLQRPVCCNRRCPVEDSSRPGISVDVMDFLEVDSIADTANILPLSRALHSQDDYESAREVAQQIATDRQHQSFEDASLLPSQYKACPPEFDRPLHVSGTQHLKTGVQRQLATHPKPCGPGAQERLRTVVTTLQQVSETSEGIAKIIDVYEDAFSIHLLQEHCSGGNMYERILAREYFTEQESAVLVKHMLLSLLPLHDSHVFHGSLSPSCFQFLSDAPQAPLKLVDFGLDLKIHWWDDIEGSTAETKDFISRANSSKTLHHLRCVQVFEACKLVFQPPEFAPEFTDQKRQAPPVGLAAPDTKTEKSLQSLDDDMPLISGDLLADVIDEHADWLCEQTLGSSCDYHKKYEAADMWSIGAIAFLLLCGYPPFFAAHRNAILRRLHMAEYSFDLPFWSKISDEAKDFVSSCLTKVCWERPSILQALQHPWIQNLAETSVFGPMFSAFMLNLRRFHRTAMMELYCGNLLARHLRREDMREFLKRCREVDTASGGYVTPEGLRQVLISMQLVDVAEAIMLRFRTALQQPGESYLDYVAMLDSVHLRQQWLFNQELWRHFQRFTQSGNSTASFPPASGAESISLKDLQRFLSDAMLLMLLMRDVPPKTGIEQETLAAYLYDSVRKSCKESDTDVMEFRLLASVLWQNSRNTNSLLMFQRRSNAGSHKGNLEPEPSNVTVALLDTAV
mmetsp:Transcript_48005/g.112054  ORF Transcript_48005/g.112054 Transcript_48005/m.112054 type:complete len:695 (-) Transcript_48005:86-2170(-)